MSTQLCAALHVIREKGEYLPGKMLFTPRSRHRVRRNTPISTVEYASDLEKEMALNMQKGFAEKTEALHAVFSRSFHEVSSIELDSIGALGRHMSD